MHDASSQVTIAGAATTNGITGTDIDGTYTISNIEHDSYQITASGSNNATATGAGGGSAVTATENRHIDVMHPVIQNLQIPGTTVRFFATIYSSQSIDGSEAAHQPSNEFEILPNKNFIFDAPKLIGSAVQEEFNMDENKSLAIRCVLSTTNEALSPVIDMNRASVHTIQNIVNSAVDNQSDYANYVAETSASGGSELTRYITKKVELNEEADIITVFMNVNRPASSNVDLYYRVLEGGSSLDITDVAFIEATPAESIPVNERSFAEVRYDIDPTGSFGSVQFKIVLRSSVSSTPPKIRDFRAICAT
jgi:hypothetical protein